MIFDHTHLFRYCALTLIVFVLTACSSFVSQPLSNSTDSFDHILSIEIPADASKETIEYEYGGTAIVWRPDDAMAILGFKGVLSTQAKDAEENKDAVATPTSTVSALGQSIWGNGFKAWAGGWNAKTGHLKQPTTLSENIDHWNQIGLTNAHMIARNLGAGVKVAVIDTGIDSKHPAFKGKLAPRDQWYDFVDNDNDPNEADLKGPAVGHGTAVAGIILQVAPNTTILPIRVLDPKGAGDLSNLVRAIDWAIRQDVDVINLSLGASKDYKALKDSLKYAYKQNVLIVAAAGNHGSKTLQYPAKNNKETVSVGSVNPNDVKSSFSAYGKELEIVAPGEAIFTTAPSRSIVSWSGTSFSAPIVTGAIALAIAESDNYTKVKDLEKILLKSSKDISKIKANKSYGKETPKKRLDIYKFLLELR